MKQPTPQPDPNAIVDELTAVLTALLHEHEALLALTAEHRRAVATADARALKSVNERQQHAALRLADLERKRLRLSAALAPAVSPTSAAAPPPAPPAPPVTLPALAAAFPHARENLTTLADRIRDVATRLSREQRAVRAAAEALAEHMQGLMKQVARKLSHAGTYGCRGSVDSPVQVTSALDLVT